MKNPRATLLLLAASLAACGEEPAGTGATPGAEPSAAGLRTRDLDRFGEDLTDAVRVHEIVYQARGTANAQMVVTAGGNVVIDTGLPNQPRVQEQLRAADAGSITHAHADHYGAASAFLDEGDMALAAEPGNEAGLAVRLDALGALVERSGDVNHYESYWLRHRVDETVAELGAPRGSDP